MGKLIVAALALALSQSAAQRFSVPGGEIVYEVTGAGPAVVLLHGAFMDRGSWDRQVPALATRYRVVRYDIRPFGESSRPDKAYSVPDDLLRLLDHLKIDRAHLMGHSFGGGVAIDFALLHPDRVASLVLVGAAPSGFAPPPEEAKEVMAIFAAAKDGEDAVLKAWLKHPMWAASQTRPDVMKALETSTRTSLGAFALTFAPYLPMTPPAIQRLGEVKAPTLVFVGDRDMPSIRQAAALMAKQIPGATLKVIAGADHALPLGWAGELNDAVLTFLQALRQAPAHMP